MKLVDLRDLLLSTGIHTEHYEANKATGNYIVWAEEGQGQAVAADNHMVMQTIRGTIEYFTKTEFDPMFDLIQEKLNSVNIDEMTWQWDLTEKIKDSGYIRHLWTWEIVNDSI
jgi:hypothetical protein